MRAYAEQASSARGCDTEEGFALTFGFEDGTAGVKEQSSDHYDVVGGLGIRFTQQLQY